MNCADACRCAPRESLLASQTYYCARRRGFAAKAKINCATLAALAYACGELAFTFRCRLLTVLTHLLFRRRELLLGSHCYFLFFLVGSDLVRIEGIAGPFP